VENRLPREHITALAGADDVPVEPPLGDGEKHATVYLPQDVPGGGEPVQPGGQDVVTHALGQDWALALPESRFIAASTASAISGMSKM
jgi:hypothetical protein